MLHAIASAFIGVATFIGSLFGIAPAPGPSLGAALPSGSAVFETSLQSRISSTDTSLTLVSNSVRGGSSLAGYNCFTIDEGRTDAEYVCGTVSGTSVTSLTRGIDPATGTSSNSALKFAHRVGADVKITDFPLLQILRNQANGTDTYEHVLTYASGVTPTNTGDLTDKEYVDGVAFSGAGIIDATSIAKGVVELATQTETASSSSAGSSGNLVIPASSATSTYNGATAPLRVVVTQNSGKIDDNFLSTSTLFATSSIGKSAIGAVGKNIQAFTSTGTSTFSVPTGVGRITVEVQGAGGGSDLGGGGAGGYCLKSIDVSATTSIQLFVGTGGAAGTNGGNGTAGTWSAFGTNGFYCSAQGGGAGGGSSTAGSGSTATGGDLNITGQSGTPIISAGSGGTNVGGNGGDSIFGFGGWGVGATSGASGGSGYGQGAGGVSGGNTGGTSGGNGIVIVRW
jgi:hypothetical protein